MTGISLFLVIPDICNLGKAACHSRITFLSGMALFFEMDTRLKRRV